MAGELRIVLRNAGRIDPGEIEDYLAVGGYKSLEKARSLGSKAVIKEITEANLRGRGGAGFSTGLKWQLVAAEPGPRYVVCNLDEGEPGTYKDRFIVQQDPHVLLEGMAICAVATGSQKGYIYCRGEYSHLVEHLKRAIAAARAHDALGDFDIEVRTGAGAYVCGEETALFESIEGRRGNPRFKPPFPAQAGIWGRPTVINNVETFATVPAIVTNGAGWFSAIGAARYPGTKVFTLTGDVCNRIVIEVPTNTTIRDIVYEFGGGIRDGKRFKAVQIGGSSGGFIPESLLDTAVDFDSMTSIGATLGTGAVFVMDETRDLVAITTRIAKFFAHESCGKCVPCREGTFRIFETLRRISAGKAVPGDPERIHRLGKVMAATALCGLGQAAPQPVLTVFKHFPDEVRK